MLKYGKRGREGVYKNSQKRPTNPSKQPPNKKGDGMIVTAHARSRIKERCGINKRDSVRFSENALEYGLKHSEITGNLKKWVDSQYFRNRTVNNIRLFGDKCFIFNGEKLITVIQIPQNLMKAVNKAMAKKRERKL